VGVFLEAPGFFFNGMHHDYTVLKSGRRLTSDLTRFGFKKKIERIHLEL
jgi:hypothetical protein